MLNGIYHKKAFSKVKKCKHPEKQCACNMPGAVDTRCLRLKELPPASIPIDRSYIGQGAAGQLSSKPEVIPIIIQ
jgi:hypothetical protein